MKKFKFFLIALISLAGTNAFTQITAGEVGLGTAIIEPNIIWSINEVGVELKDSIDLNCDGTDDLVFTLFKDLISVDGVNTFTLGLLNSDIEICMDGTGNDARPLYHGFGQPIVCGLGYDWVSTSTLYLGAFGGFIGIPPYEVVERYVAFRYYGGTDDEQIGWLYLSFDLDDGGLESAPVTASVHQALIICPPQNIGDPYFSTQVDIYPNPSETGLFTIESNKNIESYVLYNIVGSEIQIEWKNNSSFAIDQETGVFILEINFSDGQTLRRRLIKK